MKQTSVTNGIFLLTNSHYKIPISAFPIKVFIRLFNYSIYTVPNYASCATKVIVISISSLIKESFKSLKIFLDP